jgi:hypothetical protein
MRPPIFDPTAGESAREARRRPDLPRRILDPTDPRCGEWLHETEGHAYGDGPSVGHVIGHKLYEPAPYPMRDKPPGHVTPNG